VCVAPAKFSGCGRLREVGPTPAKTVCLAVNPNPAPFMRPFLLTLLLWPLTIVAVAQTPASLLYRKTSALIPMRDGVKLYTVILTPVGQAEPLPLLIERTPYGAEPGVADNKTLDLTRSTMLGTLARSGYIFVKQDIRGKYKSEGTMKIHQPVTHLVKPGTIDESTDTYDTIAWLLKNVADNNGRAGIFGISYPGWLALAGAVDPHPALKAASEQACMGDLFLGDDFHHNGAFRLSYGFEYTYGVENGKEGSDFPFPQYDLFDWYRKLGSLKNVNATYFHNTIPTWNDFVQHPNYDAFWQQNSTLGYVRGAEVPMLHVGGTFDQEDLNGPQLMYGTMEKQDRQNRNFLVLGPWYHGQWASGRGDSLGRISFGSNTALYFQTLQRRWFDAHLKNNPDNVFAEATVFQTGSNVWRTYPAWPPREATAQNLYLTTTGQCSFARPTGAPASVSYVSDPANPVPYRTLPIEATYGEGSRWQTWQTEDQRFVYSRPDVKSFVGPALTTALTVTGQITAHVFAATSGTDADWVVKLIDVYPDRDTTSLGMSGYQLPVTMEVFRGRFRESFSAPKALVPSQPSEFVIDLHQIDHTFLPGHRLMVQVQSSWFPMIDLNPQTFVPNIFEAADTDFVPARHRIVTNGPQASYVTLPVMAR
jgi:uncharacterized protein